MPAYKFRILIDTKEEEEVFRDIVVSGNADFEQFYRAVIQSFDFRGDQLASFYVSNEEWDKGHEIALMDMGVGQSLDTPSIMRETHLEEMINEENQKFILVYDFLKMWCFLVELVEIMEHETDEISVTMSMGTPPEEDSKEMDLGNDLNFVPPADLGEDISDIFSEFGDEDELGSDEFENLDDLDI